MLRFQPEASSTRWLIRQADELLRSVVYNKAEDGKFTILPPAYLKPT